MLSKLENHPAFRQAHTILLYYSLPDEVQTHEFVERWSREKQIILPVVKGDELELRQYTGPQDLQKGSFGIEEPTGELYDTPEQIELTIVPGVSFDRNGNRLGRGKGYYDRALARLQSYRIGVCFQFQLLPHNPVEATDLPMDEVWTEQGCLFSGTQCSQ